MTDSNSPFKKNLLWSGVAHCLILATVVLLMGFSKPETPKETPMWIDVPSFGSPEPAGGSAGQPQPEPLPPQNIQPEPQNVPEEVLPPENPTPEPPPEPQPEPEPVKPDPIVDQPVPKKTPVKPKPPVKKPIPKPTDKPKPPPQTKTVPKTDKPKTPTPIKVNKTEVVRNSSAKTSTQGQSHQTDDSSAFAKRLADRLGTGLITAKGVPSGGGSSGTPNDFSSYFGHVFQVMYGAWNPPLGLSDGLTSKVLIRVERDGTISKVSLAQPSGSKPMDDSTLAAANSVKKLNPLPQGLGKEFAEITVHFKIQHQ
jgi:TonB family protein